VSDTIAHAVFGLLFECSSDAALIVDRAARRVVAANARSADLLARELDAVVGLSLAQLVHEADRELLAPGHYEDVALRRGDGYPVYVQLQVAFVETLEHGELAALMARDTSERRVLEQELLAKHSALFTAYADLERAHAQLTETKAELEHRNREIAMLGYRAAMGEIVAGIAHHLNNPVGALASTVRRLGGIAEHLPADKRSEPERLLARIAQIAGRIESNVAAILQASRANAFDSVGRRPELPPELASAISHLSEQLDEIPTKERS
jgi:signal transduction histidine kinase